MPFSSLSSVAEAVLMLISLSLAKAAGTRVIRHSPASQTPARIDSRTRVIRNSSFYALRVQSSAETGQMQKGISQCRYYTRLIMKMILVIAQQQTTGDELIDNGLADRRQGRARD